MKKIILLTLVLLIIAAFTIAAAQAPNAGADVFAVLDKFTPNVGWNSGVASLDFNEVAVFPIAPMPPPEPNVGWNSGVASLDFSEVAAAFTISPMPPPEPLVGWNT